MRTMTVSLLAALCLGGVCAAEAADLDYDYLRGAEYDAVPAPAIDWSGVYLAGHGGYSAARFDFSHAGRSEVAHILQNTAVENEFSVSNWNRLGSGSGHDVSYGAIAGYNVQFDDVVLGFEADYTSVFQKSSAQSSLSRFVTTSKGIFADVSTSVLSRATLEDFGTLRVRAGYAIGPFLPFATAGAAIGRAVVGSAVSVVDNEYMDSTRATRLGGITQTGGGFKERFTVGFAVGGGVDYAITQNLFLRAEYQYVRFSDFGDHKVDLNTFRGAVGAKF